MSAPWQFANEATLLDRVVNAQRRVVFCVGSPLVTPEDAAKPRPWAGCRRRRFKPSENDYTRLAKYISLGKRHARWPNKTWRGTLKTCRFY